MYTQCPQCNAYFLVSTEQLKIGGGDVRCGQCLTVFNALEYLTEHLPTWHDEESTIDAGLYAEWATGEAATPPAPTPQGGHTLGDIDTVSNDFDVRITAAPAADPIGGDDPAARQRASTATATPEEDTPVELEETPAAPAEHGEAEAATEVAAGSGAGGMPRTPADDGEAPPTPNLPAPLLRQLQEEKAATLRPPNTPWVIGSLFLMLVFLAQAVYFARDELARNPKLRPWLEQACTYIGCVITRPPTLAKIDILGWDVHSHPSESRALIASTTLINRNSTVQPYPLLSLRFSDMNGAPVAQRRFLPREYLPVAADLAAGMPPDTPVVVELALVDPGKHAVNFEFRTEPGILAR